MSEEGVVVDAGTVDNTTTVDESAVNTGEAGAVDAGTEDVLGAGVEADATVDVGKGESLLDGEAGEATPVAPESYEDFAIPEGFETDDDSVKQFSSMAKELDLSQDQAQKLLNKQAELSADMKAQNETARVQREQAWVDELKADAVIGGKNLPETVERANRTLRNLGTPELISLIKENGYGNNPEVVKFMANIDKRLGEDSMVEGKGTTILNKTAAQIMYDNPSSQA
jgi:hypothetical protein